MYLDDKILDAVSLASRCYPGAMLSIGVSKKSVLAGCLRGVEAVIEVETNSPSYQLVAHIGGLPVVVVADGLPIHIIAEFDVVIDGQRSMALERIPVEKELTLEEILAIEGLARE
ncbi:MAG: hypothetical protein JNJ91_05230 [Flavobacteriales bacterium]|nr:hypothetical protein [Flavobacteriales bacterium]